VRDGNYDLAARFFFGLSDRGSDPIVLEPIQKMFDLHKLWNQPATNRRSRRRHRSRYRHLRQKNRRLLRSHHPKNLRPHRRRQSHRHRSKDHHRRR
jgi:hypothetical protein